MHLLGSCFFLFSSSSGCLGIVFSILFKYQSPTFFLIASALARLDRVAYLVSLIFSGIFISFSISTYLLSVFLSILSIEFNNAWKRQSPLPSVFITILFAHSLSSIFAAVATAAASSAASSACSFAAFSAASSACSFVICSFLRLVKSFHLSPFLG